MTNSIPPQTSTDQLRRDSQRTESHSASASRTHDLRQRLSRMFDGGSETASSHHLPLQLGNDTINLVESTSRRERVGIGQRHYPSSNVSLHSLPLQDVPNRKSSLVTSKGPNVQQFPSWKLAPPSAAGKFIPSRGRTTSPMKRATLREAVSSDRVRRSSSRTFLRSRPPILVLEHGQRTHRRLQIQPNLSTSIFVGGSTVEGHVKISVDQHKDDKLASRSLLISKLSIDVLGFEELSDGRKHVFLALASDLFDEKHPPPQTIVTTADLLKGSELFWTAKAGIASISFHINLPLNLGPAPYNSKQARIRYVVLTTLVFKDGDNRDLVSHSCNVQMHTVFDPQKALASLPSPLIAQEIANLTSIPGPQSVKLTCGLHRQIWVSGSLIFVDIHVENQSSRLLRKIDLQIQKVVLWYTHAAAGTLETTANHLRVYQQQDVEVVAITSVRKGRQWQGVGPHGSELCTRHILIPRQDVTVSMGRFFEVRYFLNVSLSISLFKTLVVQLPVTIIHMNSLDIMPNALAQVAASIEAKRSRTLPIKSSHPLHSPYHQGQAFVAAQKSSLDVQRRERESPTSSGIEVLKRDIDLSPRKFQHNHASHQRGRSDGIFFMKKVGSGHGSRSQSNHRRSHESDCYHCHIRHIACDRKSTVIPSGLVLPKLSVSTSGLNFTESEFTVSDSPPKKVMLSEHERRMINQQRELQKRSDWADTDKQKSTTTSRNHRRQVHSEPLVKILPPQHETILGRPANRTVHRAKTLDRRRSQTIDQTLRPKYTLSVPRGLPSGRRRANSGSDQLSSTNVLARQPQNLTNRPVANSENPSNGKLSLAT